MMSMTGMKMARKGANGRYKRKLPRAAGTSTVCQSAEFAERIVRTRALRVSSQKLETWISICAECNHPNKEVFECSKQHKRACITHISNNTCIHAIIMTLAPNQDILGSVQVISTPTCWPFLHPALPSTKMPQWFPPAEHLVSSCPRSHRPTGIAWASYTAMVILFSPFSKPDSLQTIVAPLLSSQKLCPQMG